MPAAARHRRTRPTRHRVRECRRLGKPAKLITSEQRDAWGQLASSKTYAQQINFTPDAGNNQQALRALITALGTRLVGNISGRGDCVTWEPTVPLQPNCANLDCGVPTITNADEAAQYNLPWPPQPPQWTGTDSCQPPLQSQIQSLLLMVDNNSPAANINSQLQNLITSFNTGPSRYVDSGRYLTGVPATYTTSYIDTTAQGLIDQINATLQAWETAQTNWSIALNQTHTRDALGRITQTQETLLAQAAPTKSYTYDLAGRLTSATVGGLQTTWGYDLNGNRIAENGNVIATYDSEDRLQSWKGNTYTYNAAGDLASKTTPAGTTSYTYDAQGSLRKVVLANGKTITYAIDPAGRRTVSGQ